MSLCQNLNCLTSEISTAHNLQKEMSENLLIARTHVFGKIRVYRANHPEMEMAEAMAETEIDRYRITEKER